MALHLFPYPLRLILSAGVLMHCKPIWWPALKAFNKRNIKETSALRKVCLNDPFTCLLLSPASQRWWVHSSTNQAGKEKKKKKLRLFGAKALPPLRIMQPTSFHHGQVVVYSLSLKGLSGRNFTAQALCEHRASQSVSGRRKHMSWKLWLQFSFLFAAQESPWDPSASLEKVLEKQWPHPFIEHATQASFGESLILPNR